MKPAIFTREQAKKALDGVLKRYGIDPSEPSHKPRGRAAPVIVPPPVAPVRAPIQMLARQPGLSPVADTFQHAGPLAFETKGGEEYQEFHYLVKVSGSALTFHFRTHARNAAAAKRMMLGIPHLTRSSTLLGAALGRVLDDERAIDLGLAPALG